MRTEETIGRQDLAKKFSQRFFVASHIKYCSKSQRFKSKYSDDLSKKIEDKVNNNFAWVIEGVIFLEEWFHEKT